MSKTIKISGLEATGKFVSDEMFGANAVYRINTGEGGAEAFAQGYEQVGATNLRYPAGMAETEMNIVEMPDGKLHSDVVAFMDWARSVGSSVTLVIPTKIALDQADVSRFAQAIVAEYGDIINAFEIGNEYSYTNAGTNETTYGQRAANIVSGIEGGLEKAGSTHDPDMIVQMAVPKGKTSDYKGWGSYDEAVTLANQDIVDELKKVTFSNGDTALDRLDGVVAHYYYSKEHTEDECFDGSSLEEKRIGRDFGIWDDVSGTSLDRYVTEWNVNTSATLQQGLKAAGVIFEQFQNMVENRVVDANIWPIEHNTSSSLVRHLEDGTVALTPNGAAFFLMQDQLRKDVDPTTGVTSQMQLAEISGSYGDQPVEINAYQGDYKTVFYVTSRSHDWTHLDLDLSDAIDANVVSVSGTYLGLDDSSSDGISKNANPYTGENFGRRFISESELEQLSELPFFDYDNRDHYKMVDGKIGTYLPEIRNIIPLVENPQTEADYLFVSEFDVLAKMTHADFGRDLNLGIDLEPFEAVQIVVETVNEIDGTAGADEIRGGVGSDLIEAGAGADDLWGGLGADEFRFSAESGEDTVHDFDLSEDSLSFSDAFAERESDLRYWNGFDEHGNFGLMIGNGDNVIFLAGYDNTDFELIDLLFI